MEKSSCETRRNGTKTIAQLYEGVQDESILGPLFKMLEASFELFVPLVVASMIDVGIGGRDTGYVSLMGGLLVLLGMIGLACSLTACIQPRQYRSSNGSAQRSVYAYFRPVL